MGKSMLRGRGGFGERLKQAAVKTVPLAVDAANREGAELLQREVVARIPVRTGNLRKTFGQKSTIIRDRRAKGAWRYGLVSDRLRAKAWYAHFVEFGTKGYAAGERRFSGLAPNGRVKLTKLRRKVPARPAQPFFRPAIEAARAQHIANIRARVQDALRKLDTP